MSFLSVLEWTGSDRSGSGLVGVDSAHQDQVATRRVSLPASASPCDRLCLSACHCGQ